MKTFTMRNLYTTALAAGALLVAGIAQPVAAHGPQAGGQGYGTGPGTGMPCAGMMGQMGPGMMGQMGPGMMGQMGPGMMGQMGPGMMGRMGPGMMGQMGPGMMGQMGPGMMGQMGPGMMGQMGPGWQGQMGVPPQQPARDLGVEDVKGWLERWLAIQGNPRLAVGKVEEQDEDTILAEIVTKDGGVVVDRFEIDRHTGAMRRVG